LQQIREDPKQEKAFPLPEHPPSWQDKKRTLVCLLKMRRLETLEEFAQRVWQAWQEHQAKQPTRELPPKPD
jgi:broad specificity phosphatase PhoE